MMKYRPKLAHSEIRFKFAGVKGFGYVSNRDVRRLDVRKKDHIDCVT